MDYFLYTDRKKIVNMAIAPIVVQVNKIENDAAFVKSLREAASKASQPSSKK